MFQKEVRYFLTALMFFTRIPCPAWVDHSEEYLNKSRKYFPAIGWIVGAISGFVFYLCYLVFPIPIAVLLSMMASIWITGAFHEDGLSDVCDGFGGGWGKEQIMAIMKDSRIGAYGNIGMSLALLLKFLLLIEVAKFNPLLCIVIMLNGHTISRFIASTFVHTHDYVQDAAISKAKPIANTKLSVFEMLYSGVLTLLPLALITSWILWLAVPIAYISKIILGRYFQKHIGGYTGDCLGATQQISEIVFYLSIVGLWKYI